MHLSAAAIAKLPIRRKPHFLNPAVAPVQQSLGDAAGLQRLGVHRVVVEPGQRSTELHSHKVAEECVYILSGSGVSVVGEECHAVAAGDFVAYPTDGAAHELVADGAAPLVYLLIGQRVTHDVIDYPRLGKRFYRDDDDLNVVDVTSITQIRRG